LKNPRQTKVLETGRWVVVCLPVALFFLSYPLSLFIPVRLGIPLTTNLALPSFFWLSLLASVYLLTTPLRGLSPKNRLWLDLGQAKLLRIGLAVVLGGTLASAWWGRTADFASVVRGLGWFSIPIFVAVCPKRLLPRRLVPMLGLLWLVQAGHGLWQYHVGFPVVGLAGNTNWYSPLVLALAPWAMLVVSRVVLRGKAWATLAWPRRVLLVALVLAVGLLTVMLVLQTHCRATVVVLSAYGFFFWVLPRFSRAGRLLLCAGLLLLGTFCTLLSVEQLLEMNQRDIRIPCWTQTARLVLQHPVLGVGPGNFRREFASVRSVAQKARDVASEVTEHPHNEILHVFAELGLPLGLGWCLLLLPLLWPPKKRAGIWGVIHFSACMFFGHALFDKVLVQPPDSLLAYYLLGLLWRPMLSVRAWPQSRRPSWRPLILLVLALTLAYGGFIGWRQLRNGWLLRRAVLFSEQNLPRQAYEAYRLSARLDPTDVRSHTLAGMYAINRLRNPQLALEHLQRAVHLEPDYAHVNGQIALALGTLGRHRDALPFFEREAQLYPFSVDAHQQLYVCRLLSQSPQGLAELVDRIASLRYRETVKRLGGFEARQTGVALLQAFSRGDAEKADSLTASLLGANPNLGFEPGYVPLAKQSGWKTALRMEWSMRELNVWRRCCFWRRQARAASVSTPVAMFKLYRQLVAANRLPDGEKPVYSLAMLARQAGYRVSLLATSAVISDILEIRDSTGRSWLANPATGVLTADRVAEQLVQDAALATELGLRNPQALTRLLPVDPLEFQVKAQAVGQILTQALGAVAPVMGEPPSVARLEYQKLLACDPRSASSRLALGYLADPEFGR
jgi:O-antigen ligase/tetratricopeptide (TPR) repeat protein